MNITQCRMARAGLGWSVADLAKAADLGERTVAKFETGGNVQASTVEALRQTLVRHGVEFINGGKSLGVKVPRID